MMSGKFAAHWVTQRDVFITGRHPRPLTRYLSGRPLVTPGNSRPVAFALADGAIAEADRAAALELPREAVTTAYVPADDEVQASIDEELLRKYVGAPQSSVDAMLSDAARACTLRVEPAP